jgi:hypothetical protein
MPLTVEECDSGFVTISGDKIAKGYVYLPIVKNKILDSPQGFEPDAMFACSKYVPEMPGISALFRQKLSAFAHCDTEIMLRMLDFVRDNLMYGFYNPNNPGHLFIVMQCFGGWWAGVASQIFASVLLEECTKYKQRSGNTEPGKELDMMLGVISCICKSFGCSARMPLMPHYPSGSPPDPVVLLADTVIVKFPQFKRQREDLIKGLRDWHIPKYMRTTIRDARNIWLSQNQIDRTKAFIERNVIKIQ